MVNEPLMLISSWGALHLNTPHPHPLPLETQDPTSQCNHSPGPRLSESGELAPWQDQAAADAFPPMPGKVRMQKQTYLSLPTARQGRASCCRVGCRCALGTVASSQWKLRLAPRFPPRCSHPDGQHYTRVRILPPDQP